ncbi:MAG: MATE family efflux transporter [Ignavibacteriales bacterium]|nr:MAG: MATE family efflux transporter [Ignavibacteriales bacterium]
MQTIKSHLFHTFELAYPVVIGQLGFIMMQVVDSMMVGGLGAVPLAGSSVANSLAILIFIIGLGVSIAVTPLVAISVGAKREEECGTLFRQSLIINMMLSLILCLIVFISSDFLKFLNQPVNVIDYASSYAKIIGLSFIPAMLFQTYKQFIEGFSMMRPAMVITIAANVSNIISNWLLIYGNLGFPKLGLDGAGWATFISRLFMAAMLIMYVRKLSKFSNYDLSLKFKPANISVIKKILSLGLPSGFQYFFEVGAFSFAVIMVGWLGAKELAAHQIAINLASISFMGALGISAAGSIRVGNEVGREDIHETRRAGFSAILLSASFMFLCGLIFIILKDELPKLYINDPVVISLASSILLIAALFQLSDGVQAVGIGILRGLTDVKGPTVITFIAYWIVALPVGYLLGFTMEFGVIGIWVGLLIGLSASALMLTLRFQIKSKHIIQVNIQE